MRLTIDVTINGEIHRVTTIPFDIVAWEKYSGSRVTDWATSSPGYSDIAYIAYSAMHRGNPDRPSFDDWLMAGVEDISAREDDDANPTRGAASPD